MVEFLEDFEILPVAYCPLSRIPISGENDVVLQFRGLNEKTKDIRNEEILQKLAKKYKKTIA